MRLPASIQPAQVAAAVVRGSGGAINMQLMAQTSEVGTCLSCKKRFCVFALLAGLPVRWATSLPSPWAAGCFRCNRSTVVSGSCSFRPAEAVQFNKNPFGLAPPSGQLQMEQVRKTLQEPSSFTCLLLEVAPNGTAKALLPLAPNKLQGKAFGIRPSERKGGLQFARRGTPPALPLYLEVLVPAARLLSTFEPELQVAIKNSVDIFYFNVPYDLSAVLMDSGPAAKDDFQRVWQNQSLQKATGKGKRAPTCCRTRLLLVRQDHTVSQGLCDGHDL